MRDEDFKQLIEGVKEVGEIMAGRLKPSRVFHHDPPDVKKIRKSLHVTQRQFSTMIGVTIDTVQNWEQGRREPSGAACALLKVAKRNPKAVLEALHA